jgi:hypothetical protein
LKLFGTIKTLVTSVGFLLCTIFIYGAIYSRLLNRNIVSQPEWIEPLVSSVLLNIEHSPESADAIATLVITIFHLSIISVIVAAFVLGVKLIWPSASLRKLIAHIAFVLCVFWLVSVVYLNINIIAISINKWIEVPFLFVLDAISIYFTITIGRWARTQIQTKPGSAESQG